jgi:enediyne biosynthesis protein E4
MSDRKLARVVLVIVFICLLAMPLAMKRIAARRVQKNNAITATVALSRYGFHLQEVSRASGVNFKHQAPVLDHKLDHIMPQVASMGAAVSIVDFNRDGWSDLYVTNSGEGSKNALFKNNHDGTFTDVALDLGIADVNQGAPFGATTITTVTKISFSTSGASQSFSTTTPDRDLRV